MQPAGPGPSWWRTLKFSARHFISAFAIGSVSRGAENISTNSARFSTRGSSPAAAGPVLNEQSGMGNMGTQVNAFRHVLWQATITKEFGIKTATEIGNAHEENPNAIDYRNEIQLSITPFKTLGNADESVDLGNNIIGRSIGANNKGLGMKDLALKALDAFHNDGFWTAYQDKDGSFYMMKTKITDEQYDTLKRVYQELDNNGFTEDEKKRRENRNYGHVVK